MAEIGLVPFAGVAREVAQRPRQRGRKKHLLGYSSKKTKGTGEFHLYVVVGGNSFGGPKGRSMTATQHSKELRAFCYEHHVEMRLAQNLSDTTDATTQALPYACTEPDCLVHYNIFRGYFVPGQKGNTNELDMVPNVRCLHDGTPMYLAELNPDKTSFRLWICPRCDRRHTNEQGLIGLASEKAQDASGKSWVEPNP